MFRFEVIFDPDQKGFQIIRQPDRRIMEHVMLNTKRAAQQDSKKRLQFWRQHEAAQTATVG
jgi:hypothetical protein